MIIDKVYIEKFRGFKESEFELGSQLTVIAGQNGTQKTTLLGIISQPFTITNNDQMKSEKPLCGGSYKSAFGDKFKLSSTHDLAGSHEWTMHLNDGREPFTVESIHRDKDSGTIRFWKKGDRSQGAGYIQLPVIYLSLKRLYPIGEDKKINISSTVELTDEEKRLYARLHNEILISLDELSEASYLEGSVKTTLGINTEVYDWQQNSAGQDNVGMIILALLSFMRLQKKYEADYEGGLLVIDEIDATMYPAAQQKLLEVLRKYASKLKIQIIFTTHSLSLLKDICDLQKSLSTKPATKDQVRVLYLEKRDGMIMCINNAPYATISNRLNVAIGDATQTKIDVFTEDGEAVKLAKKLLHGKCQNLNFVDVTFSGSTLVDLVYRKVPHFGFPRSIVMLDGDVKAKPQDMKKIKNANNVLFLPSVDSPERLLAKMLYSISENDSLWESINRDYCRQVCFRDISYDDIMDNREKAKEWFNGMYSQIKNSGFSKIINKWKKENSSDYEAFVSEFNAVYNKFAKELSIDTI